MNREEQIGQLIQEEIFGGDYVSNELVGKMAILLVSGYMFMLTVKNVRRPEESKDVPVSEGDN